LGFAAQMANLSGGNVTFTTIPTAGAETSTNQDALATDPAQLRSFFTKINGKAADSTPTTAPSATPTSTAVDPASVTVDVQNATKVNKLAASVSATLAGAGFRAGEITSTPGITQATAHKTTTISYPAGAKAAAQAVRQALGNKGTLVPDDSVATGHISVAAGTDMSAPSGLRAPGAALAAGAVAAPTTTVNSTPAPLTAATVGCVN
jgi:hypothetical protein